MTNRILAILLIIFISFISLFGQSVNKSEAAFTIEQLKTDFKYLRNKLERNHPSLYLYTQKLILDQVFDSLENSLSKPMTQLEFYKQITVISSIIKDGHTIILPGTKMTDYYNTNSKFLPYHFAILNNRLYVDMVCTNNHSIPLGAEIIRINDVDANEIIKQLSERQVRDGNNLTYPIWILSNYFREYYSYMYGHPENYLINYKVEAGSHIATIHALSKDSIYYYRHVRYPAKLFSKLPNEGIKLKIEKDKNYAVLTIKDFDNKVLKSAYKQNFKNEMTAIFEQVDNSKVENLILDLRNNQGGDIENGVFLLSYLLDKPFAVVQEYFKVKHSQLQQCKGPSLGLHKPRSNHFEENLYVLINGGSFSNSGIVASCLKANKRAIFIGEEMGGNPDVIAGFIKNIQLPNTKIRVQIPTKQFIITSKEKNSGQGIMPTHIVEPTLEDILEDKDTALNFAIDLISKLNTGR